MVALATVQHCVSSVYSCLPRRNAFHLVNEEFWG